MYNRYVPQSDGSYRRSRMQEQPQNRQQPQREPPQNRQQAPYEPPTPPPREEKPPEPVHHRPHPNQNVSGFFRNLLPPNFDTGDLIIMLLLLLLAGDCQEDKTTAMLTLVLYLFMG